MHRVRPYQLSWENEKVGTDIEPNTHAESYFEELSFVTIYWSQISYSLFIYT